MKKIFSFAVALVAAVSCVALTAGCGGEKKVKVIEIALTSEQYAVAVQKGNADLVAQINEVLAEIKGDGTFDEIYAKYDADNAGEIAGFQIATSANGIANPLIMATSADFPPFENVQGEKFVGIDIEIALLIAEHVNKTLVISNMDFDSIIPAVQNGTADFAMAGLTVNDDRKSKVDFSDSYIDATQYMIVKADDTKYDEAQNAEELLALINGQKGLRVGAQKGTTGYKFAKGDESFEYAGFSDAVVSPYNTGALAVQDLINGNLDVVILDKLPALKIAAEFNK